MGDRNGETGGKNFKAKEVYLSWYKWCDFLPHSLCPQSSLPDLQQPSPGVWSEVGLGGRVKAGSLAGPHWYPACRLFWRSSIQHLVLWKSSPACDEGAIIGTFLNFIGCF